MKLIPGVLVQVIYADATKATCGIEIIQIFYRAKLSDIQSIH
jgi:hypothetical protein